MNKIILILLLALALPTHSDDTGGDSGESILQECDTSGSEVFTGSAEGYHNADTALEAHLGALERLLDDLVSDSGVTCGPCPIPDPELCQASPVLDAPIENGPLHGYPDDVPPPGHPTDYFTVYLHYSSATYSINCSEC